MQVATLPSGPNRVREKEREREDPTGSSSCLPACPAAWQREAAVRRMLVRYEWGDGLATGGGRRAAGDVQHENQLKTSLAASPSP